MAMDPYEPTKVLFSRIKSIDPENVSKIMGYLLIQDLGDRDLMRLAFAHDSLLHTVVLKAKTQLGLSPNTLSTPSPTSPSLPSPISRPFTNNSNNNNNALSQLASRVANDGFLSPKSSPFLSYDNIRAASSTSVLPPSGFKNGYGIVGGGNSSNSGDGGGGDGHFVDEFQLDDYFSFLNDSSSSKTDFVPPRFVTNGDTHQHKRSFSASDACFETEEAGFGMGYKPCLYFAKGFCKNGENCKFVHGDDGFGVGDNVVIDGNGGAGFVGSPGQMEEGLFMRQQQHEEMVRMKAAATAHQQQRLVYNKYMSFLLQQQQQQNEAQRLRAATLLMGDEPHKFGRNRLERNDFLAMGLAEKVTSASRQIYLTFPADSTFKDEDVSNYFSLFGPVQDVRIPYQQKRMFGFVTFVHPETVKLILARGNPHFICDSRVLVKPYKEKGKVVEKRQQHLERGNFLPCSSPTGIESRELYDLRHGARMSYNTREMMLRRKLEEQAELQQAIEIQGRRLMNLQLPDLNGHCMPHHHHHHHHQRSLSLGAPISLSPRTCLNQTEILQSDAIHQESVEDYVGSLATSISSIAAAPEPQLQQEVNAISIQKIGTGNSKEESVKPEGCDLHECHGSSVEQVLPDSLFASPTKSSGAQLSNFSTALVAGNDSTEFLATSSSENNLLLPTSATSGVASR